MFFNIYILLKFTKSRHGRVQHLLLSKFLILLCVTAYKELYGYYNMSLSAVSETGTYFSAFPFGAFFIVMIPPSNAVWVG